MVKFITFLPVIFIQIIFVKSFLLLFHLQNVSVNKIIIMIQFHLQEFSFKKKFFIMLSIKYFHCFHLFTALKEILYQIDLIVISIYLKINYPSHYYY